MTIDEFLKKLAATTGRKWTATYRSIRSYENGCVHCPISAVAGNPLDFRDPVYFGAVRLGLARDDARVIMHSADGDDDADKALRARLLAAVGLAQTETQDT